ncbi:MAG: 4Fe-4S dicluster domain-containing protein [Euryarchaeota archaeon]|nr:4Fe-4S dicluster domain-containing protein [Euryarchaeota archaeon]
MGSYKINKGDIQRLLENLLKRGLVEGILVQSKGEKDIFTTLITDPGLINTTAPLAPLFSSNSAKYLRNNGFKNIAVFVKPCEARAINELIKLNQIRSDNILVISADCHGTIDPKDGAISEPLTKAKRKELEGKGISLRKACTVCEHFTPPEVDISIMTIGIDEGYILVTDNDEPLEGLDLEKGEVPKGRDAEIEKMLKERSENKEKMVSEIRRKLSSVGSLTEVLKNCIRCDNCREMCPICYCKECYFETPLGDLKTDEMLYQAVIKGALRVPPDILFYHLTRNMHVASSCVECGACEEACPRDLPLLALWKAIAGDVQALFKYASGMKGDEPLPLAGFKESELEEVK